MLYLAAPRCDCPERSEGQYARAWQSSHPQEPWKSLGPAVYSAFEISA